MQIFLILVFFIHALAWAGKKERRHHEVHEHGAAKLQIAFDGLNGQMVLRGAALPFLGFESESNKTKKQEAIDAAKKKFEAHLAKMIIFDSSLSCIFKRNQVSFVFEKLEKKKPMQGEHADIFVESSIVCEKPVSGTVIHFDLSPYPDLKDLDIDVISGNSAQSIEVKNGIGQIQLMK